MSTVTFLLVLDFFAHLEAVRFEIQRKGNLCKVEENADIGDHTYNINFALDMGDDGGCSTIKNCNYWNMRTLATKFIEKPFQSPPTASIGRCTCNLKPLQEGESRALPSAKDQTTLFEFVSYSEEPCNENWCWVKYNQFVYLTAGRSSGGRNKSLSGNHWKIGCGTGAATLAGLKPVSQLLNEASKQERSLMMKYATELQVFSGEEPASSKTEGKSISQSDALSSNSTVTSSDGMQVFSGEEPASSKMEGKSISQSDAWSSNSTVTSSDGLQVFSGEGPASSKMQGKSISQSGALSSNSAVTSSDGLQEEMKLSEETIKALHRPIQLLITIEENMARGILKKAEEFTVLTKMMADGNTEEAILGDWEACATLWRNMNKVAELLEPNDDTLQAFMVATRISGVDPSAIEAFLMDAKDAMALQRRIIASLHDLVGNAVSALAKFRDHHGQDADREANFILNQLALIKSHVAESRAGLQSTVARIMAMSRLPGVHS